MTQGEARRRGGWDVENNGKKWDDCCCGSLRRDIRPLEGAAQHVVVPRRGRRHGGQRYCAVRKHEQKRRVRLRTFPPPRCEMAQILTLSPTLNGGSSTSAFLHGMPQRTRDENRNRPTWAPNHEPRQYSLYYLVFRCPIPLLRFAGD